MPQVMNTRSVFASTREISSRFSSTACRPDLGARAGAEAARELLADLDLDVGLGAEQRLRVRVDRDELDAVEVLFDHAVHGVAAAAADAHDLHAGVLRGALLEFEDHADATPVSCKGEGAAPAACRAVTPRARGVREASRGRAGRG
jgi:hypothetical protein